MSLAPRTSQVSTGDDANVTATNDVLVFGTLPEQGMDTMTEGGVEFVLCASALTAQM